MCGFLRGFCVCGFCLFVVGFLGGVGCCFYQPPVQLANWFVWVFFFFFFFCWGVVAELVWSQLAGGPRSGQVRSGQSV